ncbi:plakophilin-4-like isoform X4 [Myxocyprinus asiaticus]|uniref:plakophilin-4-like isoform X4 n=1 Tax=Myxocyprinus asiaticus TaxID=70543 RepID=UPI0022231232|nr:plakophilin-4-like isoform X4 [Myxocyprinus asiaticus]
MHRPRVLTAAIHQGSSRGLCQGTEGSLPAAGRRRNCCHPPKTGRSSSVCQGLEDSLPSTRGGASWRLPEGGGAVEATAGPGAEPWMPKFQSLHSGWFWKCTLHFLGYLTYCQQGGMPAQKPIVGVQVDAMSTLHCMQSDSTATNILASVKEQELQFERLTRELEVERQIVASQLERCRLGSDSPGAASGSSSEKSFPWRAAGSVGNSRSSTQMNSYSDSGYQDAGSYYSSQTQGKCELRPQHSFPGSGGNSTLQRNSRAEGQAAGQALGVMGGAIPGRAMRRVVSMPTRTQSPYGSSISPSRGSLHTAGSSYGSPIMTEPKPLPSVFTSTTLTGVPQACSPYTTQKNSPVALRRIGSINSRLGSASRTTSPYSVGVGYAGGEGQIGSGSPAQSGMAAVPQHYGSTMLRAFVHDGSDPYSTHNYEIYKRIALHPDNLTGVRASYASQHSQMGADLRSAISPDRHIGPIYEGCTFQGPLYRSPSHAVADLNHNPHSALYRSSFGVGNLQQSSSQHSNITYQRSNYTLNTIYTEPYQMAPYRPSDPSYTCQPIAMDDDPTHSPSIDSIQKDPREFAWRDPELAEVIHMLQHQFPSVQANAAAYLQHLCYGDNHVKKEVCRLGGIKHLVDLLDHKVLEVQRHTCGALRNLVYGRATDDNKVAVRNAGGVPALLRLLRATVDTEVRELVSGVLWNLSSCDAVKMTIIRDALSSMTNTVVIPHLGWSNTDFHDEHKLKFHSTLVLRNTTGCLRNLSSAGEEARKQMRCCDGLIDSLLYVIKACVSTSDFDSKIVENCICTLRNLSYRLELEMPPSQLTANQELDGLLGSESPSKETEYSCWWKKRRKKKSLQEEQWDGVGPIPGFSKCPKGAEMLWHPSVVKPYLTLLAESSNPATLEGSAGSLQNLSAGNCKFAVYIRAAVRKEKGLPILVELLRMDNDRVVCSITTALRNMALDIRNKELIGKYAMRDLVNRLPGGNTTLLSDDTVTAICCTLHEVTSRNMENAKSLADTGGIEKLVNITKGRGERYSMKVVKAAAQVLNTLWQYRDLRAIYKKDGWNQNHFLTPVSTLERESFKSLPTQPSTTLQMSPVHHTVGSTTSSPAMLGIKERHAENQTTQSTMQFYNYQGEDSINENSYTGSAKASQFYMGPYTSPSRESSKRGQVYYADEMGCRNYDTYRTYLQSPQAYEDSYLEETVRYSPADCSFKTASNYVDFYSSTRRPSYRTDHYPTSPDSWV